MTSGYYYYNNYYSSVHHPSDWLYVSSRRQKYSQEQHLTGNFDVLTAYLYLCSYTLMAMDF